MSDYPTEDELQAIRVWPVDDLLGWFAHIKSTGNYWPAEAFGWSEFDSVDDFKRQVRVYHISTGGWSGNEEIIDAMRENTMCWILTWQEHRRGGHYAFSVPKR
jgi:hypothetical protein